MRVEPRFPARLGVRTLFTRPVRLWLLREPVLQQLSDPIPNESEERFRALADAAWEGICFSENGIILDANRQLADILGYEPHELIGRSVIDLVAPDSVAQVIRALRLQSSAPYEHQAIRKDGSVIIVEVRAQVVSYKGRPVRITAIRDVTDRVRAAEHRRALVAGTAGVSGQHFFRSLVKHLAKALGARGAFVAELVEPGNDHLRVLSAWEGDDYLSMADAALSSTMLAETLTGGLRFFDGDLARQFADDALLADLDASSCAAISLEDANGSPIGVLAIASDFPLPISDDLVSTFRVFAARAGVEIERIRAERQVRRFNQELEQRVADRTRELESANRELEAFSYSVSHDLRAPLRQVLGFVDLLSRDLGGACSPNIRQHLTDISDSAKRMSALIDTLLDFSRTGRAGLCLTELNLGALADELIHDVAGQWPGRRIEWVRHELPQVRGDLALVRQVLTNLIDNAVKFTRFRSVAQIEIGSERSDADGVVCYVRDNGVGFNMQRVDKLFGVFQRLHPASKFEGTGIGLANVQRIVLRHGGRVWARGEVGQGATFYFTLPLAQQERVTP